MTTGTKITLWSIGGLVVATGLFFGIRALIRTAKNNGGGNIPPPPLTATILKQIVLYAQSLELALHTQ